MATRPALEAARQHIVASAHSIPTWVLYGAGILIGIDLVLGFVFSCALAIRIKNWIERRRTIRKSWERDWRY